MQEQSYAKHAKFVPMFHFVLGGIIMLSLIGSFVNLWQSWGDHERLYSASLIVAMAVALFLLFAFTRSFAMGVQDRAIRAEENLRHFALTGKRLDPRLTIKQIVGLRFASDAEFVELARKAAEEAMPQDTIKKSVKNWRADHDRV
ncbi:MAG: DUF6526 family protein [Acidobacteriia bacterium]|nr:DUF6526 family protein [Terriglobia bacterium]